MGGTVVIGPLLSEPGFNSLTTAVGQGLRELALRQKGGLRALVIEGGYVELPALARSLPKDVFEQTSPGVYVARLPILVRHGATLHIGPNVKQLRLSQDRGALLANEGALFVVRSEVIGWSEQNRRAREVPRQARVPPLHRRVGRIAHVHCRESSSRISGTRATKSFGLSFSQYSSETVQRAVWPRPTGLGARFPHRGPLVRLLLLGSG